MRKAPPPTPNAVAARLLTLLAAAPAQGKPRLRSRAELARLLAPGERSRLNAALERLEERREVLALRRRKSVWYIFAEALRSWLVGNAAAQTITLEEVYRRLVRESGGFPDVKIAALRSALGPAAEEVSEELIARWRRGEATLSLGDWSLASEETRAAAVELHGERYLLVRLEQAE